MPETIASQLSIARKALVAADIDGSFLDTRLLLQAAANLSHEDIVASPEMVLDASTVKKFSEYTKRRLANEPVSRILGTREFYGRSFQVTPAVLDPRADTETLIDLVLERHGNGLFRVLDMGTGSGAILITLLAERIGFHGVAIDVSPSALQVAKMNGIANGVAERMQLLQGSWFDGVAGVFDLIVSNPPYIPSHDILCLDADVKNYDPHLALDGGEDGLFAYRAIATNATHFLTPKGGIFLEIGAGQQTQVVSIFQAQGYSLLATRQDLGGHVRALEFGRSE